MAIFKSSLEADMFLEIASLVIDFFGGAEPRALALMTQVVQLPRFGMLLMFPPRGQARNRYRSSATEVNPRVVS